MKILFLCSLAAIALPSVQSSHRPSVPSTPDRRPTPPGTANLGSANLTQASVAASTFVSISQRHLAFLADESTFGPGGTDLNGDADLLDFIAYAVDTLTSTETNLAVATNALAWIGPELYLVVDESMDGRNWEPSDTGNHLVLLHWSAGASLPPDYVDLLAAAGSKKMIAVGTNLFYSADAPSGGATSSTIRVVTTSSPTLPSPVSTTDPLGSLSPRLIGADGGLIFLRLDESAEGRDLNADADLTDRTVLALLDGTLSTNLIRSTELATPGASSPFRAKRTSPTSHDWQVGFLVSESNQGATNLNATTLFAASWNPPQCAPQGDLDVADDVLSFLDFAAWHSDPVGNPIVNTGLVGCRKIAIANGYIATITPELDTPESGAEGICDLNADGDLLDYVVRWVRMISPVLPLTPAANIHALFDVPGGTHGLAELNDRFVIQVSESEDDLDINGDALKTLDLLGWLSPSGSAGSSTPWDFTHFTSYVGSSWTGEQPDRARLGVALEERVSGANINAHIPPVPGEDLDTLDSVPTFSQITGSPENMQFPGVAIAVDSSNAGIVFVRGLGFYRVDEAEDSRDWNADGDETDFVLFGISLTTAIGAVIGTSSSIPGRLAIEVNPDESPPQIAAYLASEALQGAAGTDLNGDGDTNDLVVGWFFLGEDCDGNNVPDDVDIANGTAQDCNGNGVPDSCDIASGSREDLNGNGIPDSCEPLAWAPYCFGDLSGAVCPCGNIGPTGRGCRNSTGQSAQLAASGSSIADTVELSVSGELPTAATIFIQSNTTSAAVPFGDGLRCVSGTLKRLYVKTASGGQCSAPGSGDPSIRNRSAALGDPIPAGEARFYMTYYRDGNPSFCPSPQGSTFNASNALFVVW